MVNLIIYLSIFYQITDLLVNITKHVLKPKHRVLTDQEKKRLLKKYNIEEKQVSCFILLIF
jgi:DNA-directed RNA polymerase I, II, and III subunit RPABC1